MARKLISIIEAYKDLLAARETSEHYREWCGLWVLSAAIERKLWVMTKGAPVYPNLYIMLIGKSGCGKGMALTAARKIINKLGPGRLSASSMTAAFLAQSLQANERKFKNPITEESEIFHGLHVFSPEVRVLFNAYDIDMISKLTDLWDCDEYSEGRREATHTFYAERTYTSMLVGSTPDDLHEFIPEVAWGSGFMSRVIIVMGDSIPRVDLFAEDRSSKELIKLEADIAHDVKEISKLSGQLAFTPEARQLLNDFYRYPGNKGGPPVPNHPNFITYCERRHMQIEKLMILYCIDEGGDMLLTEDHFVRAYDLLMDAEARMPDVFLGNKQGNDLDKAERLLHAMYQGKLQNDPYFHESRITRSLLAITTVFHAKQLFSVLIESGKIVPVANKKVPEALRKKHHDSGTFYEALSATFGDQLGTVMNRKD